MEVVSKPCQDQFLHPILVHSISEKKENKGSQMGHTKKRIKKKRISKISKKYVCPERIPSHCIPKLEYIKKKHTLPQQVSISSTFTHAFFVRTSFLQLHVSRKSCRKVLSYVKFVCLTLMKLITATL